MQLAELSDDDLYAICQVTPGLELVKLTQTSARLREICRPLLQARYQETDDPQLILTSHDPELIRAYVKRQLQALAKIQGPPGDNPSDNPQVKALMLRLAAVMTALVKYDSALAQELLLLLTVRYDYSASHFYYPLDGEVWLQYLGQERYRDLPLIHAFLTQSLDDNSDYFMDFENDLEGQPIPLELIDRLETENPFWSLVQKFYRGEELSQDEVNDEALWVYVLDHFPFPQALEHLEQYYKLMSTYTRVEVRSHLEEMQDRLNSLVGRL